MEIKFCAFKEDAELEALVALQNEVYKDRGLTFTKEIFKFWYSDNPCGNAITFNAYENGELVAHEALVPEQMLVDGRVVKCVRSMGSVTHPDFRGRKLLSILTNKAIEEAQNQGYEFVYGIANGNSFHSFVKYCGFSFVGRLDVKFGVGKNVRSAGAKLYSRYWSADSLAWRLGYGNYYAKDGYILKRFKMGVNAYMGAFDKKLIADLEDMANRKTPLGINLYVGLGAKLPWSYLRVPKFIKHSPFNLIFRDLTEGQLPPMTSSNLFYQLIDFDVA